MEVAETLPVQFRFEQDDDISVSSDLDKAITATGKFTWGHRLFAKVTRDSIGGAVAT